MKRWEALTGAQVMDMRQELRLSRDAFMPYCMFPDAKSAARLSNIEKKNSWKPGDRERVRDAFRTVYAERGLPVPEAVSDAEYDGPPPPSPPSHDLVEPIDPSAPGPSSSWCLCTRRAKGWTLDVTTSTWVCGDCGKPSQAYVVETTTANGSLGDGVDVVAVDLSDTWDELLETLVLVDTSEVRRPDYVLTNSEMRAWKRCRRKWWLEYYRRFGVRTRDFTSSRATGDRVHRALAAAYAANPADRLDARDALERAIVEDWTEITRTVTDEEARAAIAERFNAANALERAIIEGYIEWLAVEGADADYTVEGAEQVLSAMFEVDVDGDTFLVELIGKLDARLRRSTDGALLFIDHKSVGSFTDVIPTLRQNEQMLTYVLLEALNAVGGERVGGALYNMLRRVKRTANAKPPFYQRVEVPHNDHEVETFRTRVRGVARDVLRTRRELDDGTSHQLVVYPTPTTDCRWDCAFFAVCGLFDDGTPGAEDMLNNVYVKVDPLERYEGIPKERTAMDVQEVTS